TMTTTVDGYPKALDRPMTGPPGRRWTYNGGATALLGRLIEKGTERQLHDFARDVLFNPLGIGKTEWRRGQDGEPIAASGLRLTPRGLARIGVMLLGKGQWNGRQVIPADLLAPSFTPPTAQP